MNPTPNEAEEKAAFAVLLLKTPNEPFKAAIALFPDNTPRALWVANHWVADPEVLAAIEAIKADKGEMAFLPTKAELAKDIWDRMQGKRPDGSIVPPSPDDYAKLAKLYADIRNFIEKPATGPAVTVVIPRAIEVPTHGTDDQWELAAEKQQTELLNVSRSRH